MAKLSLEVIKLIEGLDLPQVSPVEDEVSSSKVKIINYRLKTSHIESSEFVFESGRFLVRLHIHAEITKTGPAEIESNPLKKVLKQKMVPSTKDEIEYNIKLDGYDILTKTVYSKPLWSYIFNKEYGTSIVSGRYMFDTEDLYKDFKLMVNKIKSKGIMGLKFISNKGQNRGWIKSLGNIGPQKIIDGLTN